MPLPFLPILAGVLFAAAWGSSKKKTDAGGPTPAGGVPSDVYVPAGYQAPQWQANPIVRGVEGEQVVRAEVVPTMLDVLLGATPVPVSADHVQLTMPGAGARAWAEAQAAAGRAVLIRTDPRAAGELWSVPPAHVPTAAAEGAPWAVLLRPSGAGAAVPQPPLPAPAPELPAPPLPPLPPIPGAPNGVPGLDLVPEPQRSQVAAWLANPVVTPEQLRQLAAAFGATGDPRRTVFVAWLEARAKELEGAAVKAVAGGHTYTLRTGAQDNASALAKWFTGDAGRWREILAVNPKMVPYNEEVTDAQGNLIVVTKIRPWIAGQVIQLPASWDASKGSPPMAGGAALPKKAPPMQLAPMDLPQPPPPEAER